MSAQLLVLVKEFLAGERDARSFTDEYRTQWKLERDKGTLQLDSPKMSEKLSSIFCVIDMYNPDTDREDYEYDEPRMRSELSSLVRNGWD